MDTVDVALESAEEVRKSLVGVLSQNDLEKAREALKKFREKK